MKQYLVRVLFGLMIGLTFTPAVHAVDRSLTGMSLNPDQLPQQVLLIPPVIQVKELSAGGVSERVDEWTEQAKNNLINGLNKRLEKEHFFDVLVPPELPAEEQNALNEHAALYDVVGFNAFYFGNSQFPAWKHKKQEFDYTLGDGLNFLVSKTGAQAALFVIGEDYISSGGRKAARLAAALLGVILPPSPTFLTMGLVDLQTGNILWMNYAIALDSKDMRKAEDVDALIDEILKNYPSSKHGS